MQLHFSHESISNLRLVEVNNDILKEIEVGNALTIRGDANDDACLCTSSATYHVKALETSNCLLISDLKKREIHFPLDKYYVLEKIPPQFSRLLDTLISTEYSGELNEKNVDLSKAYSFDELLSHIQASKTELIQALDSFHAFNLRGKYRIFSARFASEMSEMVVATAMENNWNLSNLNLNDCINSLEMYPSEVVKEWFKQFVIDGKLNTTEICKCEGIALIRGLENSLLQEFMEQWEQKLSLFNVKPDIELLNGIAIIDDQNGLNYIYYYPPIHLPASPLMRVQELFKKKKEWTLKEIEPYLADITTVPAQFLLNYAQIIHKEDKSVYISRSYK